MFVIYNFFLRIKFFILSFCAPPKNFKLPINLIFFVPNNFKYFLDSIFCGRARVIFSKIFLEKLGKNFHLLKDFFVILALRRINGILF